MTKRHGLPTLHVVGNSVPQAYWRAIYAVYESGLRVRTQYDRRNDAGEFIDPPSIDATVMIEIFDPLDQPRVPPISFCEIGAYMLEILGLKDFKVPPLSTLRHMVSGGRLSPEEAAMANHWPYTYHERLHNYPSTDTPPFNQIAAAIEAVAKTPYTRRAMATTAVPNLDPMLTEDIPCLREVQLRCFEDKENGHDTDQRHLLAVGVRPTARKTF